MGSRGAGRAGGRQTVPSTGTAGPPPEPPGDPAPPTRRIRDRIVETVTVPASSLRVNPRNWRTHPEYQTTAVTRILEAVGSVAPLIARRLPDGTLELIDGHLRAEIADNEPVRVSITDLTEAEALLILTTFDQTGSLAVPDVAKLGANVADLKALNVPLLEMGWPAYKLEGLGGYAPPPVEAGPPPGAGDPGTTDVDEVYRGMPAFSQEDQEPAHRVTVQFETAADMAAFAKLIGQPLTGSSRGVWWPAKPYLKKKAFLAVDAPPAGGGP